MKDIVREKIDKWVYKLRHMSTMKIIPLVFLAIILAGTFLLTLPIASKEGATSFSDALFTATSATCVTGLIRFDTYNHWTLFGQIVIISMIQIGGIGFMSIAVWILTLSKRKIGLQSRMMMQNSISAPQVGGMVSITKFILMGTVLIEGIGAVLLSFVFIPEFGWKRGIYYAAFHSVSAFCNAGFDLMGIKAPFSSLTSYAGNWYVNIVIMLLVIIGGLGFFVWKDLLEHKFRFKKMKLHTKIVMSVSMFLVLGGAVVIFFLEWGESGTSNMSLNKQILTALFQSVTSRTAGFNTVDLARMTEGALFVMIVLMLIGGSPGSTAGGMKTTTFAILVISIHSTLRRKKSEEIFGRRLEEDALRTAACIFMIYLFLGVGASIVVSKLESIPILTAMFEVISALGTVGITLGITSGVSLVTKIILIVLMYIGRVGSLTILMAFSSESRIIFSKLPLEKVQIG